MSEPQKDSRQVWIGIGITALLHLLLFFYPEAFLFIGVAQIVYMLPAMLIAYRHTGIVQGMLIGMGITFLLNAACFGIVFGTLMLGH